MPRNISRALRAFAMVVVTAAMAVSLASPAAAEEGWDPTLPKILSAGAPGDPVAVAPPPRAAVAPRRPYLPLTSLGRPKMKAQSSRRWLVFRVRVTPVESV